MSSPRLNAKRPSEMDGAATPSKLLAQSFLMLDVDSPVAKKAKRGLFEGQNADIYQVALQTLIEKYPTLPQTSAKFSSKIVPSTSHALLQLSDIKVHYQFIQTMLTMFLKEAATRLLIADLIKNKKEHYEAKSKKQIAIISQFHECFTADQPVDVLRDELPKLEAKYRENIENIIEDIETGTLPDFNVLMKDVEKLNKMQNNNGDPIGISFAVLKKKEDNFPRYLVALSSPQHNESLLARLNEFFEQQRQFVSFKLCETVSEDFNRLLLAINETLEAGKPRKPNRRCAEKSLLASIVKWQGQEQSDLECVFNFALTENEFSLKPSCVNCEANMPGADVLLASENIILSPAKKPYSSSLFAAAHHDTHDHPVMTATSALSYTPGQD